MIADCLNQALVDGDEDGLIELAVEKHTCNNHIIIKHNNKLIK